MLVEQRGDMNCSYLWIQARYELQVNREEALLTAKGMELEITKTRFLLYLMVDMYIKQSELYEFFFLQSQNADQVKILFNAKEKLIIISKVCTKLHDVVW